MKKTIFITGSTDGIGKLAAIKLLQDGNEVIIHGRNESKVNTIISELQKLTDNNNISAFIGDFSNLDSVRNMAEKIKQKLNTIDVLINNAGVFNTPNLDNESGLDLRIVVNYLAPYHLTNELLKLLKNSTMPQVINLSSAAQASVDQQVLSGEKKVSEQESYSQSKLALIMWSFYLAKQEPAINVIALNPGSLLNTKMVHEAYGHHWSSADKGASIIFDFVKSKKYESITNKYFDNDKGVFATAHADAYNEMKISTLMKSTMNLVDKY